MATRISPHLDDLVLDRFSNNRRRTRYTDDDDLYDDHRRAS